jgi:hypothetical protein
MSDQAIASDRQNNLVRPTIGVSPIPRRWWRWYLCAAGILFLIPLIFWTGPFGDRMSLGGDASLLFFEYPWTYLTHSALGLLGNNLNGYNPQVQYVPFLAALTVLKGLDLNVEGIVFGLVLSFSFTGTVRLVATLSGPANEEVPPQAFLAGAIYVCAPIVAIIEWVTLLPRFMWLALTPWLIVLVIRHQRDGGVRIPVFVGLMLAFTAPAITDAPGTIAAVVAIICILSAAMAGAIFRLKVQRLVGLVAVVTLINAYWLLPFLAGLFLHSTVLLGAASASTKQAAVSIIHPLAAQSSISNALSLQASTKMAVANGWVQLHLMHWSSELWIIGALPRVLVALSAAYLVFKLVPRRQFLLLTLMTIILVVFLFLVTASVGPDSASAMAYLVTHIPSFTAERNFWSTWVPTFALVIAITVGLWTTRLLNDIPPRVAKATVLLLVVAFVFYDLPFFAGREFRLPYSAQISNSRVVNGLQPSFTAILAKLETLSSGAVLTLPLNDPDWTQVASIQADPTSGAYIGTSPVFYLTGRSDYDGAQSFGDVPGLQNEIEAALQKGDIASLANTAAYSGVRYVVSDDGALRLPNNIPLPPTSTSLAVAETKDFLSRYASKVLYRSGPYTIRALAPWVVVPRAALVPKGSVSLNSDYLLQLARGKAPSNGLAQCGKGHVVVTSWSGTRLDVVTRDVQRGCVLRILIPGGTAWRAETGPTNSSGIKMIATNAASVAFEVPQGSTTSSIVTITYVPSSILVESAAVSGVGLVLVIALSRVRFSQLIAGWDRKRRRRNVRLVEPISLAEMIARDR